ncbi:D-glycerate dehydrogenase [Carboxydochorda subterranea]|uniref:D-glycerate dehydrogenase n=1 Tax=Carboxydichorda subterranea TaxID=3109565 RepID=A0ABZ1BYG9_9FIRM|nr:D-glycerate dehydrogenase [Limnochorda sp. L945t]WRP17861.1 D-glycerate dehydrogenase [Limnochorda sp. L945t]
MGEYDVYVTRRLPEPGMSIIQQHCRMEVNPHDRPLTREELLRAVRGRDGLVTLLTDRIDAEVMDAAGPQLRVVSNYAVGFNNVDVQEATRRRIVVTNTPGVLTETTADLAWALLMAVARRVVEADAFMRAGKYNGWSPTLFLGTDVYGKTLGIVGFGRIGQAVARRASGFGMRVLYHDVARRPGEEEARLGVAYRPLDELLSESDFVTLHVDLNPRTHHLIDARALSLMKPTAFLINTSRGPVVDEAALVRALEEGRLAGAGLDVFENEPAMAPGLARLPNVVVLPHIASASKETRSRMAEMAATNLVTALGGGRPAHVVNPEVLG